MKKNAVNYLWKDRKRKLGMKLSFTKYALTEDRFLLEKGFLNKTYEELLLYRIRDISLRRKLGQRIFGVGTIILYSSDTTSPSLEIINVKNPVAVKELLHNAVEESKVKNRVRVGEYVSSSPMIDTDGDGIPDLPPMDRQNF